MYVHMFKAPQAYGLSRKDFLEDPDLMVKRLELVGSAAQLLNNARLIRVDARQNFTATDMGRVAARYYVDYETCEAFAENYVASDSELDRIFIQLSKLYLTQSNSYQIFRGFLQIIGIWQHFLENL